MLAQHRRGDGADARWDGGNRPDARFHFIKAHVAADADISLGIIVPVVNYKRMNY